MASPSCQSFPSFPATVVLRKEASVSSTVTAPAKAIVRLSSRYHMFRTAPTPSCPLNRKSPQGRTSNQDKVCPKSQCFENITTPTDATLKNYRYPALHRFSNSRQCLHGRRDAVQLFDTMMASIPFFTASRASAGAMMPFKMIFMLVVCFKNLMVDSQVGEALGIHKGSAHGRLARSRQPVGFKVCEAKARRNNQRCLSLVQTVSESTALLIKGQLSHCERSQRPRG
ncbi:hypothetical protein BBP40_011551 [Aspergillus hancockii]|nr:hypothetical protein BBP40_011551 [Aspergillus hancockii]